MITAPKALREARREPLPGDRETRLIDDKEKAKRADYAYVNTGSLEELDEFVGSVRRRSDAVRRLVSGSCRSLPSPASAAWLLLATPDAVAEASATRCATRRSSAATRANYHLEPCAARGGDRRGVEVPRRREVAVGRDRADAAPAVDRARASRVHTGGSQLPDARTSTTRRSTSATARGTSGTCSTSTTTSARRSPPTTRARTTSTAGSPAGSGIRLRRDARLRRPGREAEGHLRRRLGAPAGPLSSAESAVVKPMSDECLR